MNVQLVNRLIAISNDLIRLPQSNKKHFSFLIKKKRQIVGVGWNNGYKTEPLARKFGMRYNSIHSELAAIKSLHFAPIFLGDLKLVNIRIKIDGSLGLSRPCKNCIEMLRYFDIYHVYYTNDEGQFEYENLEV